MDGGVLSFVLCNLSAGVQYHIEVAAATSRGYGPAATIDAWTEIGVPHKPAKPRVSSTGPGTITVLIQPVLLTGGGPLSAYFVVVSTPYSNGTVGRRRRRVRRSLPDPVAYIPLPGVAVARLATDDVRLARYFVVGDGRTYGGYENSPLTADILYIVHYVVASSLDGVVKMSFASTDSPVAPGGGPPSVLMTTTTTTTTQPVTEEQNLSRDAIIAIAVVGSVLLLLILLVVVILIYCRCCKDTPTARPAGSSPNASWLKYYTGTAGVTTTIRLRFDGRSTAYPRSLRLSYNVQ